jgi:hypothetical protein
MISEKEIKELGLESINDFYHHVITNKINGNLTYVKETVKRMSINQHSKFLLYMRDIEIRVENIYLKRE